MTGDYDNRPPLDPHDLPDDAGEFSWGPGLTPKGLEHAPPSQGGMCRGTTPACDPQVRVERR